jgi:hypothetical protein
LKVETEDGKLLFEGVQNTSDNRSWMPDEHITEDYLFPLPTTKGQAKRKLKVRLSDELSGQEIKLGLKGSARDEDGYYTLCLF